MTNKARIRRIGFLQYWVESWQGSYWKLEEDYFFPWSAKRGLRRYLDYGDIDVIMEDQDL